MSKSKLAQALEHVLDLLGDLSQDAAGTATQIRAVAAEVVACKTNSNNGAGSGVNQLTEAGGELPALARLIVALLEGTARNLRIVGLMLLVHVAGQHPPTFVRAMEAQGGVGLWARAFDICAAELFWGLSTLFDDTGTELHALLLVVERIVFIVKNRGAHDAAVRGAAADLLCAPLLSRLRDLAKGSALAAPGRARSSVASAGGGGLADEIRRAATVLLRALVSVAPRKHVDACCIVQALIDLYLSPDGAVVVTPGELSETLTRCCLANRLSAHDTAALFFPYVDVALPGSAHAEAAMAARRGRCEMVLRYLASSMDGVAVFNATAPLGLRLLVDALGLPGGSVARKMLLMHLFVVLLHSAAPHREVHESGPWLSYAKQGSTHNNNFMLRSRSFLDSSTLSAKRKGAGDELLGEEGGDGFDLIEDEQDFKASLLVEVEKDGILVEAEPTTFFPRDTTLGALLLVCEREGLSRALVSVLLPAGEKTEIDPQLADGAIALMQTVLGLMRPLLSLDVVISVNQALDNAIANLLMRKNPIIGALISKKAGGGIGGASSTYGFAVASNNNNSGNNNNNAALSLSDRLAQTRVIKVAKLHEWNLFATLDVIQSRILPPALVQKDKSAQRFCKTLLAFYSPDGLGDASLFGEQPFKAVSRSDTIPTLGIIGVALVDMLLRSGEACVALLVEQEIPKRLTDFFVGALMSRESHEALTKTMAGDYLRWIRSFTACTEGLRLLSASSFFQRVRDAAKGGMAPQVWEMVLRAFSGKPIVQPDPLGRYLLPQSDPRPQFFVDILSHSLAEGAAASAAAGAGDGASSDLMGVRSAAALARSFGSMASAGSNASSSHFGGPNPTQVIRYAALSQLFVLASRARFGARATLNAAVKAVFDVMVAADSDPRVRDLASQLLSMWLRLGGADVTMDTDEYLAFEAAAGKLDQHVSVTAFHIHSVLHTCLLIPRATEGNAPMAETLRRCMERIMRELSTSHMHLEAFLLGPLVASFEESHFYAASNAGGDGGGGGGASASSSTAGGSFSSQLASALPMGFGGAAPAAASAPLSFSAASASASAGAAGGIQTSLSRLPAERRCGALRAQLLGAIADTPRGSELLQESTFLRQAASIVKAVAEAIKAQSGAGGGAAATASGGDHHTTGSDGAPNVTNVSFLLPTFDSSAHGGAHNNTNSGSSAGDDACEVLMLNRLVRDPGSSALSWVPATSYAWGNHHSAAAAAEKKASAAASTAAASAGQLETRQADAIRRIHVALAALGTVCTTDSGAELVGAQVIGAAVTIAASSLGNETPTTSCFAATALYCLSLMAQSYTGRAVLSRFGPVRSEPYHDPSTNSLVQVAFMSPTSSALLPQPQSQAQPFGGRAAAPAGNSPAAASASALDGADPSGETVVVHLRSLRRSSRRAGAGGSGAGNSSGGSGFGAGASAAGGTFRAWHGSSATKDRECFSREQLAQEPFATVVANLHDPAQLKSKLAALFVERPGRFLDTENRAQLRHALAQAVKVPPESRHVLSVMFYMPKETVNKFCASAATAAGGASSS